MVREAYHFQAGDWVPFFGAGNFQARTLDALKTVVDTKPVEEVARYASQCHNRSSLLTVYSMLFALGLAAGSMWSLSKGLESLAGG